MALFSRRSIYALLTDAVTFLPPSALEKYVQGFNGLRADYVALEWELATLVAFKRAEASLVYEPSFGGRKPDFALTVPDSPQRIIADITTVSDSGIRENNPAEELYAELSRRIRKLRRKPSGGFTVNIGSNKRFPLRGERTQLKMPPAKDFNRLVFNRDFDGFVRGVCDQPAKKSKYAVADKRYDITIGYNPDASSWTMSHDVFTLAERLRQNPLFNALTGKLDQLRAARSSGACGVIVCDGGCDLLRRNPSSWSGDEFSIQEIVNEFFRQHPWVAFVMTATITSIPGALWECDIRLTTNLYCNRLVGESSALEGVCRRAAERYPKPIRTATNARHHLDGLRKLRTPIARPRFLGGLQVSDRHIRISARVVLELLSGRFTTEEFARFYATRGDNPFQRKLRAGYVIESASVESGGTEDDDWIVFRFSEKPDVAAAQFSVPEKPQS